MQMSEAGGLTRHGSEPRKSYFVRPVMGRHRPVRAPAANGGWDFAVRVVLSGPDIGLKVAVCTAAV